MPPRKVQKATPEAELRKAREQAKKQDDKKAKKEKQENTNEIQEVCVQAVREGLTWITPSKSGTGHFSLRQILEDKRNTTLRPVASSCLLVANMGHSPSAGRNITSSTGSPSSSTNRNSDKPSLRSTLSSARFAPASINTLSSSGWITPRSLQHHLAKFRIKPPARVCRRGELGGSTNGERGR
jgi:hypothetical protein